jgi:hypothetical protein
MLLILASSGRALVRPKSYNIKKACYSSLLYILHAEVSPRETREGRPLLTVETENGDSKNTNESGPSVVVSLALSCR